MRGCVPPFWGPGRCRNGKKLVTRRFLQWNLALDRCWLFHGRGKRYSLRLTTFLAKTSIVLRERLPTMDTLFSHNHLLTLEWRGALRNQAPNSPLHAHSTSLCMGAEKAVGSSLPHPNRDTSVMYVTLPYALRSRHIARSSMHYLSPSSSSRSDALAKTC